MLPRDFAFSKRGRLKNNWPQKMRGEMQTTLGRKRKPPGRFKLNYRVSSMNWQRQVQRRPKHLRTRAKNLPEKARPLRRSPGNCRTPTFVLPSLIRWVSRRRKQLLPHTFYPS